MASLKNRRGIWYARVQWYQENLLFKRETDSIEI